MLFQEGQAHFDVTAIKDQKGHKSRVLLRGRVFWLKKYFLEFKNVLCFSIWIPQLKTYGILIGWSIPLKVLLVYYLPSNHKPIPSNTLLLYYKLIFVLIFSTGNL
jgi:hypothetical protein